MSVFREYDIRGIAERDLSDQFAWALGRSLSILVLNAKDKNIYVGQDVRLSSPRLANALSAGLQAGGLNVAQLEVGPTPLLYFAAHQSLNNFPTQSGIMVTGSHNPTEYNGFKMVIAGQALFGDDIQKLRSSVESFLPQAPKTIPTVYNKIPRADHYVNYSRETLHRGRRLKVVVDAGNGSAGPLAIATYEALGFEVIPLFCEPDGRFPNHHPDPTVPANLKQLTEMVINEGAEVGIAFDGDGDRIGAVSSTGRILFGDQLVLYYSRSILKELPGSTIISEVKSSQVLYDTLEKWGARAIIWKTGHSLIKSKLKETKGALAGEMSGHIFFAHRYFGYDDAVYAGARLLESLSQTDETLDTFLDSLPPAVNTPEIRVDCDDSKKFQIIEQFVKIAKEQYPGQVLDIDGARVKLHGGWGLMRASNTQPVIVMRFEAQTPDKLEKIRSDFAQILKTIDDSIGVPPLE